MLRHIILCYVFVDHQDVAKYSLTFCNLSVVSGQDFKCTPCLAVPYFLYFESSVHNIRFIECYHFLDHQEVVTCRLKFTMLISTTARQTRDCMQIITYHIASFRTNHFQNTPCPADSYFLISSKYR